MYGRNPQNHLHDMTNNFEKKEQNILLIHHFINIKLRGRLHKGNKNFKTNINN